MSHYDTGEHESGFEQGKAEAQAEIDVKQAKIDALMLEYCPDEMTKEQLDNWAKHQMPHRKEECAKCKGTGWYHYDHNHSKKCECCCSHVEGWWELTEHYAGYIEGADNRCCLNGCGTMKRELEKLKKEPK